MVCVITVMEGATLPAPDGAFTPLSRRTGEET